VSVVEYWKSLAVSIAAPGSLGSDAYRVLLLGRSSGYLRNAFVIVIEKVVALFSCALLIACAYPLIPYDHAPGTLSRAVETAYFFFLAAVLIAVFVVAVRKQHWAKRLGLGISAHVDILAARIAARIPGAQRGQELTGRGSVSIMMSLFSPAIVVPAIAFSLAVLLIAALQAQFFFDALGYHVPFTVNVVITPVLFLVFSVPISFGGIGIREATYVLLYGAFGVPAEAALLVSFCAWFSILSSQAIGAVLLLGDRKAHGEKAVLVAAEKVSQGKRPW
jgi:uncharacterized membrane protein YbhN (UPF0104 family)